MSNLMENATQAISRFSDSFCVIKKSNTPVIYNQSKKVDWGRNEGQYGCAEIWENDAHL